MRCAMRYVDTEGAGPRSARQGMKTQAPVAQVDHDRNEDADPATVRCEQQRGSIGFAVEGQIGGVTAALKAFRSRRTCTMLPASNGPWGLQIRVRR